tara:strand:- start:313 stop:567 length:255 start_codon:yes stop_codon:yes gene_type:complete
MKKLNGRWNIVEDYEETMETHLSLLTADDLYDIFSDFEVKDLHDLAKLFNSKRNQDDIGRWLNRKVCQHIEQLPDFWEKYDDNQ